MTGHDRTPVGTVAVPDAPRSVADVLEPVFEAMLDGPPPFRFEFWDGSSIGPLSDIFGLHIEAIRFKVCIKFRFERAPKQQCNGLREQSRVPIASFRFLRSSILSYEYIP